MSAVLKDEPAELAEASPHATRKRIAGMTLNGAKHCMQAVQEGARAEVKL